MAAFRNAYSLGFRYMETDVHLSRDGVLVAFHDSNLLRTCGVDREIASLTISEISQQKIDGTEPIPLLQDLFEEFPDALFNIDAKSDEAVDPLVDFLRSSNSLERVCIGSFSHRRLRVVRAAFGSKVCTSASPAEVSRWMLGLPTPDLSCVQIPMKQYGLRIATLRRVERSSRLGIPVHIWTVDQPWTMQTLMDAGVHGIMTDDGLTLKSVARRNLLWTG